MPVQKRRFRLLTREEFKNLSVREMLAYQRDLAAYIREHIDDTHAWILGRSSSKFPNSS